MVGEDNVQWGTCGIRESDLWDGGKFGLKIRNTSWTGISLVGSIPLALV